MKKLSVIIPTLGRKEELFNTLNDLSIQNLPKEQWEVIVVIQNEPNIEEFRLRSEEWGINLSLYFSSAPNASLARNIGLLESKGDVVLFLDDDLVIKNPDFLQVHLSGSSNPQVSGVFGQVLDPGVPSRDSRHRLSYKKHIGWMFFPPNYSKVSYIENGGAGNLSVRRNEAIEIGGMDINYEKGAHREESDFCLRLTRKNGLLLFDPRASIIHLGAANGGCRQWGKNEGLHPDHHVFGEWYFILKGLKIGTVKWYHLHFHLTILFLRQIWNQPNRHNKIVIPKAFYNSLKGFNLAIKRVNSKEGLGLIPSGYEYKLKFKHEF